MYLYKSLARGLYTDTFLEFIITIVFLDLWKIHPAKEQKKPTQLLNNLNYIPHDSFSFVVMGEYI